MTAISPDYLVYSAEVAAARAAGRPIVALESTIITHGMPYPANVQMAADVEQLVRDHGAVPATIAVIDGRIHVGLDEAEREALAQAADVMKVSRADFGYAVALGRSGGTTVAATMIAAAMAGIEVFATGGIGGVHRGAEETFDESADILELARTSVIVVSAGAKAILDIPKTLERLETHGVPVVVIGQDHMPAFWSSTSDIAAPLRLDTAGDLARLKRVRDALGHDGGILVANPIPVADEIGETEMAGYIEQAIADSVAAGIRGKDATPYLLQRILELTEGRSLVTNIALVKSNARFAAALAVALAG